MFKPNTVPVPRALLDMVQNGDLSPEDIYYAALRARFPSNSGQEIRAQYGGFEGQNIVDDFYDNDPGDTCSGGQQPARQRPTYDQSTPKIPQPDGFQEQYAEWCQEHNLPVTVEHNEVKDFVYDDIITAANGDLNLVEAAIIVAADYHNNKHRAGFPAGLVRKILRENDHSKLQYKADRIRENGTAIDRESRMQRSRQRMHEKRQSRVDQPRPNPAFIEDDEDELRGELEEEYAE